MFTTAWTLLNQKYLDKINMHLFMHNRYLWLYGNILLLFHDSTSKMSPSKYSR